MRLRLTRVMVVVVVADVPDGLAGTDVAADAAVVAVDQRGEKHHGGDRRMQWWYGMVEGDREKRSF
jgi:hypothetical protein